MQHNDALLDSLKQLWNIQESNHDSEALNLINRYLQKSGEELQEQIDIQNKVLAKTRRKTEELLKQVQRIQLANSWSFSDSYHELY